jgi:hypothetical protein
MVEIIFAVVCFAVVGIGCALYFVPFMIMDIVKNYFAKRRTK